MCLGRPMSILDRDCTCELPANLHDDDLVVDSSTAPGPGSSLPSVPMSSPMAGFLVICKLGQVLGQVSHLGNSVQVHHRRASPKILKRIYSSMQSLGISAPPRWLQRSSNSTVRYLVPNAQGGIDTTMCVVASILHSGALMTLHWSVDSSSKQRLGNEMLKGSLLTSAKSAGL